MKDNIFGIQMCKARRRRHMTRAELAAKLFYSEAAVSEYERGRREPKLDTIPRIAEALGTTSDYLLGMTTIPAVTITDRLICEVLGVKPETVETLKTLGEWEKRKLEGIVRVLSEGEDDGAH